MKKFKTLGILLLAFALLLTAAACGEKAAESPVPGESQSPEVPQESGTPAAEGEAKRVLFSCMSLSDSTFIFLDNLLRQNFEGGGYVYDAVSAEMDPVKQIEQIENASVQGYDLVVVIPVNGEALTDACRRAMDDGTLIFAFIFDTIARNCYRTTDPVIISETAVELAMDWVNQTFPDAEDGSVNCVVMGNDADQTSKTQHDAGYEAALRYPQLHVIENITCEGSILDGQARAENILTTYPDTEIHLWIVTDAAQALGVNAAVMAEHSGVDYIERVCVTGSALSDETVGIMKLSQTDEGVIRVCAAPGGKADDNIRGLYEQAVKMLNGEPYDELCPVQVDKVWPEDLASYGY